MKIIAFLGRTNAGKSTLMNCLTIRSTAAISEKVHTTRTPLREFLRQDKEQWMMLDSPGLCRPKSILDKIMFKNLLKVNENSDLVWLIADINERWGKDMQILIDLLKKNNKPTILVINKIDLKSPEQIIQTIPKWKKLYPFKAIVPISAKKKKNISNLIQATKDAFVNVNSLSRSFKASSLMEISKEIIREQILLQTNEEIPHQTALILEKEQYKFQKHLLFWKIIVNKNSQKVILIGKNSKKIETIRKNSEAKLKKIWKHPIFLSFLIEVESKWFQNKTILQKLNLEWKEE